MVPRWKRLQLRVFVTCATEGAAAARERELILERMLQLLRIRALAKALHWRPPAGEGSPDEVYLLSACQLVRSRSSEAAVAFLYLPEPPRAARERELYLAALGALTEGWPPTLMVRGVSPVTSITL